MLEKWPRTPVPFECPRCRGRVDVARVHQEVELWGHTFAADFDGNRCEQCELPFIEGLDMYRFELFAFLRIAFERLDASGRTRIAL